MGDVSVNELYWSMKFSDYRMKPKHQSVATILFASAPIFDDETSTVSPILRNRSSGRLPSGPRRDLSAAVPADVPPAITSPGTKGKSWERYSSPSPNDQIISLVL